MKTLEWDSKQEMSIPTSTLNRGESDPDEIRFTSKVDLDGKLDTVEITEKLWRDLKKHPAIKSAVDNNELRVR